MTGVPRHMAEHHLNVREGHPPVRQKKRGQAPERNKAIQEEVEKLADAVLSLPSPRCLKDVQKLNGKLASLNRFLSKSAEKSLPFFKTLKKCTKKSDFQWTQEAEVAFKQMKKLIAKLSMLTAPKENEELIMYLAAAKEAISAVLMTERGGKQLLVYFPIKQLLSKSEISGRMLKWKFKLEGYDIQYRPRISIKGQILADFIVERPDEESSDELVAEPWTLFTDWSSCVDSSGAGLILTNSEGVEFAYTMRFSTAEREQEGGCPKQDCIYKLAHLSKQVLVEELKEKSIHDKEVLAIVEEEGQIWMTPICEYLTKEILSEDKKKARVVRRKASRYTMINGTLYKKSFLGPWLRCIGPLQANYVLREIHEGSCSMHSGPRSVVVKAIRMGYYWPTMHTNARKLIRECNYCQVH
ncbi:reverse transcriptase domain-containing protein [Tanacetum coccineum]